MLPGPVSQRLVQVSMVAGTVCFLRGYDLSLSQATCHLICVSCPSDLPQTAVKLEVLSVGSLCLLHLLLWAFP